MKLYTITHIADWEGGVTIYGSENAAWSQVLQDVEEIASDTGLQVPDDRDDWEQFIRENGWRVQRYDLEEHAVPDIADDPFVWEPPAPVLCGTCNERIVHDNGDPADSWLRHDGVGGYHCPATDPNPMGEHAKDHAPAIPEGA